MTPREPLQSAAVDPIMAAMSGGPRPPQSDAAPARPARARVAAACAALLVAFAVTSWSAVRHKGATADEPLHSTAAYLLSRYGDYRVNPEDPPLWQRWAALAEPRGAVRMDPSDVRLRQSLSNYYGRWLWLLDVLYHTPGNDADAFLRRQRAMMVLLGVLLGALIARWAWALRGPVAAVAATGLFALDPNFLAHAALVKNDVAIALASFALAYATWRAGRRLTAGRAVAVALLVAAVLLTKFSGPLVVIAWGGVLLARVLWPAAWLCFGREVRSRAGRLAVAGGMVVTAGVVSYAAIWANYSFRFAPAADGQPWQLRQVLFDMATRECQARHPDQLGVTRAELNAWRPDAFARAILFLRERRALPDTYLTGMLYTFASAQARQAFLCGKVYVAGSAAYFPLAFAFKTPLATQAVLLLGAAVTLAAMLRGRRRRSDSSQVNATEGAAPAAGPSFAWAAVCLWVPFAVLASSAITARLNLGIRHILVLYPVLFVAGGCAAARLWRQGGGLRRVTLVVLAIGLAAETVVAFPNYIPFFNAACGGPRGGLALLGDSNLDWGQDLPLLADWQRRHPDRKLSLCYFGSADPHYYGIDYHPLPGTVVPFQDVHGSLPTEPGVLAVSATALQGINTDDRLRKIYGTLRDQQEPIEVLGGTIYLYDYDPR